MIKKENRKALLHYLFIILIVFAAAVLQNTAGILPEIQGARAFILIPAVAGTVMFCTEIQGLLAGILAGCLWDIFSTLPDGISSVFLGVTGFLCAFFIRRYMINSIRSFMLFSTAGCFIFALLSAVYYSSGFDYGSFEVFFTSFYFPSFIYTTALSPLIYFIIRGILGKVKHQSRMNVRNRE